MRALLISTYELGRQPWGLASPAAWLRQAGWQVQCVDLTKDRLRGDAIAGAALIGFHLPMHTATRLAAPVIAKARELNPSARLCAYGLYAPLNLEWLRSVGIDDILGGEFEEELTSIAREMAAGSPTRGAEPRVPNSGRDTQIPRIHFLVPDRRDLPALDRYAMLHMPDGTSRIVGSTEASRGCKHLCRHCPIVPVYEGQFRIVAPDVVLADIDAQVAAGAQHITFGDPDFFNGPTHALRIVDALHAAHPSVTYDVTIKIEHLLKYPALLDRLRDTGCLFVTSAVESVDDVALGRLDKGHTRSDFIEAVARCRACGLTLVPTFVAFQPWLTLAGYCDLLDTIEGLDLVDHIAPIQLAIRLLIPQGSKVMELEDVRAIVEGFDPITLTYRWSHPDPRVDALQREIAALVGVRVAGDRRAVFEEISALAHERAGVPRLAPVPSARPMAAASRVPYLSEPWYCCAEPNPDEVMLV
ncbi:MAG: CUAEP/CCAEP-tail radical SAM protein [Acidobacteriota bacterium]